MRAPFFLLPILALAACATPREACISGASRQVNVLQSQVNEVQGNINRGFAYRTVQEVRTVNRTCSGTTESGETFTYDCPEVETRDRREPVPINMEEQRRLLADLQSRLSTAQRDANAAIQQCIAIHPE